MNTEPTIKNFLIVILPALLVVFLIFFVIMPSVRENRENVGGQKDEHGCLTAAGYSWDEKSEQCVRVWEEEDKQEAKVALEKLLANKYNRELSTVVVTIHKIDGVHVSGGVNFNSGQTGNSGNVLAYRKGGEWTLAYDGNGSVDCLELRALGFSEMLLHPQYCD